MERKKQKSKLFFILTEVNSSLIFTIYTSGVSILSLFVSIPFIFKFLFFLFCFLFTLPFLAIFLNYIKNFDIEFQKYILSKRTEDLKPCTCGTNPNFYYNKDLAEENPKNPLSVTVYCPNCHKHTGVTNKPNLAIKSWNSDMTEEDMIDIFTYFPIY